MTGSNGQTDLAGIWEFAFLGDVDVDTVDIRNLRFDDRQAVPGCFDATPAYAGKRGLAAYRRTITLATGRSHRLILDGLHHWGRVFVDGQPLCDHVGGFTRFGVALPNGAAREAQLVVLVDNRIDPARCPLHLEYFDWYHYGGIARGAWLESFDPRARIDAVRVITTDWQKRSVRIEMDVQASGVQRAARISVRWQGNNVLDESVELRDGKRSFQYALELPGAATWSPDSPNLQSLTMHLLEGDEVVAQRTVRFGIRQVRVEGRQILLNDQPLRLLGFNRHESHPQFGHAVTPQLMVSDLALLRDMGCNFVRGSHYPQDERFLNLCDELGICVWSESIGWQHNAEHLNDPAFIAAQKVNMDEMVAASINHPSIILWGCLNEAIGKDAACRSGFETLIGHLRALDPSRPVTYASMCHFDDKMYDLVDIVSINCYPGWYVGELDEIGQHIDKITDHLDKVGQGGKPLIISEVGAAAMYGCRDAHETRWSEQYQAKLLEIVIDHLFVQRSLACGLAIWQFTDGRTSQEVQRIMGRPRGFNNKGVLDEYRRPKMAYESVKRMFGQLRQGD